MTDLADRSSTPAQPHDTSGVTTAHDDVVARLRATFAAGTTRSLDWRRAQLAALHAMLDEHEDEFTDALRLDLGRPATEAYVADIAHAKTEITYLRKRLARWAAPDKRATPLTVKPGKAIVVPEPLGVVLVIAPWNYPIQLLLEPMAAAIAAGNAVVGKPSELAPACSALVARLAAEYLDRDAVVIVEGAVPETTDLLARPWDHVFFTGSTSIGRVVMKAAAEHLTPVTLELGGKSPTYVAHDADLAVAARRIAFGKFLNAGQTCIAPDYVLVDRAARDELVERLAETVRSFYGDDPKASASYGRIVNERHHGRLTRLIADGAGAGTIVVGGEHDVTQRYIAPTITVDPDPDGALMADEIFGPILPVIAVDDVDDAIARILARPKPLALYVFSSNAATVDAVIARTSSGGMCINHTLMHLVPPELPFGGVGPSGMGSYHGKAGFDAFSHHKSVLRAATKPDVPIMYPPYSKTKLRILKRVI